MKKEERKKKRLNIFKGYDEIEKEEIKILKKIEEKFEREVFYGF